VAHRFSRFEIFLLFGMAVTGVGLATLYIARTVDLADRPESTGGEDVVVEETEWILYEDTLPPEDYFQIDRFEGVTVDGVELRGRVVGYPLRRREIKISDDRSGREIVVAVKNLERFRIRRRPRRDGENPFYCWKILHPGGRESVLYGFLVEETDLGYVVELESGTVTLTKKMVIEYYPDPSED
jgi:hypothetical protein